MDDAGPSRTSLVDDEGHDQIPSPWTHNVVYGLISTAFYALGNGLFQSSVLPSFILEVGGNNFSVGFAEGIQGISGMVSALPAGYLADKWSRKACIRLGAGLQIVSNGCLLASVAVAEPGSMHAYVLLCAALSIGGVCDGIIYGPLVALMDDSCPAGRRSDVETANSVVANLAQSAGPLLGLVVFLFAGNYWTLRSMKFVVAIGVAIAQLAIFPVCRMDDNKSLGEQSEAVHLQKKSQKSTEDEEGEGNEAGALVRRAESSTCCGFVTVDRVRYILFLGEILMSLGAGMTVKFFPVFFNTEGHINPALLQSVFASLFGLTAIGTLVANKLAKRFGRMQIAIPSFAIGISCTVLLGVLKPFYTVPAVMLPIFLLRCVIQWSNGALLGSVIADYTPKATRGRWKALSSIIGTTWSGSAAVGGFLIDRYGFGWTFVITGCFQASCLPLWCLITPLVAKESELLASAAEGAGTASESSRDTAVTPTEPRRCESGLSLQEITAAEGVGTASESSRDATVPPGDPRHCESGLSLQEVTGGRG